ncbi:helix-turn-helix transcriptional regulator [Citrobacter freundii]|jgi:transcriptional regulator with XRE-family HTH domain|uniref:Helix-turn-helix domain-containing protein n=3 Tax=Enterobacteriaceae TaxID=543 RepID=A0ABZ0HB83_9ENTR|nr:MULTISPECIES: helix-turn-helix domain-containing protein [Enterobacteriaceae]EGG5072128.1 helix-turn-helix domain-containing protein [Salmonella enterica]ELT6672921.1 helix-turn-helix domain-containing protein [Escherichia coli]EGU9610964.1 helix-turn-helix domain-containing protein [Salmonella enterica]EKE7883247.1 helix-turn-helix domain-containing protein [Salmonella enterica]EKG3970458.1 helix-turn-helix domain-containing protein [Salmonella enterica]
MNNREFKEIRLSAGLTQAEFASRLGLARETVCRIERCAYPVSRGVSSLAKSLLNPDPATVLQLKSDNLSHDGSDALIAAKCDEISLLAKLDKMIASFRYSRGLYGRNKVATKRVLEFLSELEREILPRLHPYK